MSCTLDYRWIHQSLNREITWAKRTFWLWLWLKKLSLSVPYCSKCSSMQTSGHSLTTKDSVIWKTTHYSLWQNFLISAIRTQSSQPQSQRTILQELMTLESRRIKKLSRQATWWMSLKEKKWAASILKLRSASRRHSSHSHVHSWTVFSSPSVWSNEAGLLT